jgi:hypothetical protein
VLLEMLRRLAIVALEAHGVHGPSESFITDEMAREFSRLVPGVPAGEDPSAALRPVLQHALDEYDA